MGRDSTESHSDSVSRYAPPKLRRYGQLTDRTHGNSGSGGEGGPNMRKFNRIDK